MSQAGVPSANRVEDWNLEDVVDASLENTAQVTQVLRSIDSKLTILLWITALPWILTLIAVFVLFARDSV